MGGQTFSTVALGATAKEAFISARNGAQYEYGHGGYTGTIAEKDEFVLIDVPSASDPVEFAETLISDDDPRINYKWGPAGCVKITDGTWLFFGWASS